MARTVDAPTALCVVAGLWVYLNWWLALTFLRLVQFNVLEDVPQGELQDIRSHPLQAGEDGATGGEPRTRGAPGSGGSAPQYNNADPAASKAALRGRGKRANAAMNNHAEQLPHLAVPLLFCVAVRGPEHGSWIVAAVALAHALCRTAHVIFYVFDYPSLRSSSFTVGFLLNFVLWALAFVPSV
jgi:uncharacterized MAPEG superfamily protein